MSVGVCVINRNGIALAADSAGTFSPNRMFYNSMNKVFSLSYKYTYGAILYGKLALHNVSMEQILSEFRRFLDEQDCLEDFFEIVPKFQEFIAQKSVYYKFRFAEVGWCNRIIQLIMNDWGNRIKDAIESGCEEGKEPDQGEGSAIDETKSKIGEVLDELEIYVSDGMVSSYDVSQYVETSYRAVFDEAVRQKVPKLDNYPDHKDRFWKLIAQHFNLLMDVDDKSKIGLLFAGYGRNDAFPKYIHVELYSVIGEVLKFRIIEQFAESNSSAKILPLAQSEVVYTFCKGISDKFIDYIPDKVEKIINAKIDALPDDFTPEQKEKVKEALSTCRADISGDINSVIRKSNVDPILASVSLIPLSEMAFLAESLVNITSLKRTYVLDGNQQTVGGPTDVAILSKGEGFAWVKKK